MLILNFLHFLHKLYQESGGSAYTNNNEPKQLQLPSDENEMVNITTQKPLSIYVYLFFAWSALALVLFVRKITIYQGFIQYIKAGNTEVSDIKNLNLLSDCEEKLNIKVQDFHL